jgi:hypothetical protein
MASIAKVVSGKVRTGLVSNEERKGKVWHGKLRTGWPWIGSSGNVERSGFSGSGRIGQATV